MDVFVTKIDLAGFVTKEKLWDLIKKWLINSPHYGISEINYSGQEAFTQDYQSASVSVINTEIDNQNILAVRFINNEEENTWKTDCIFTEFDKSIRIRLSCESSNYSSVLPKLHKPYIIKMLFDEGFCNANGQFPITDSPIKLSFADLQNCGKMMKGEYKTCLPSVYVSYNSFNSDHYAVDVKVLALKLSGIAHVLVEPNKEFSNRIKEVSAVNNAYNGYIGIYYPGTTYKEILSYRNFYKDGKLDKQDFAFFIRETVQQAALNYANVADLTWDKIQIIYHRKKYHEQEDLTVQKENEMDEFISAFDEENKRLRERIQSLTEQLSARNAQIESLKKKYDDDNVLSILKGSSLIDYFPNEISDCIMTILEQSKSKIPANTRSAEILNTILENNPLARHGEYLYKEIRTALREKSIEGRRKMLEECGFTIKRASHDKIIFHDDKYTFSLSNSPSDYREADNMYSDIMKQINIYKV